MTRDFCRHYAAIVATRRRASQAISTEDALIASIALTHGYPLATRKPVNPASYAEGVDEAFAAQVNEFIEQYKPALEKLAE